MARLLRLHFASIGHRDARLAPLTLDFRHARAGGGAGRAADTVLWLRNGGGKSSILNLFYSVFRPSVREFLGSSAEGRSRKLSDYVQGSDLAFVVTEWDADPADALELFDTAPAEVRVAGQVLAWKGQRLSADVANLRRLFFSLRAGDSLAFDALPIHGLGEPAASFDAFRDWLRDASHAHGAQEVVYTENQKTWLAHLEKVGLDPELFRYQLRMNQREGAADEVFRFTRDEDFVRFLLELALEPEIAEGVAQNLKEQQENLRRRPVLEIERRFLGGAVGEVGALAAAVRERSTDDAELGRATREVAAVIAGLERRADERAATAAHAERQLEAARERLRAASNLRDLKQRWSRGLERLAVVLDEKEARATLEIAQARHAEVRRDHAHAEAATHRVGLRGEEVRERELREALAVETIELEPLRRAACAHGSVLHALLDRAHGRRLDGARALVAEGEDAWAAAERAAEGHASAREARGVAEGRRAALDVRIEQRDRARDMLLRDGVVERREPAATAIERWTSALRQRRAERDDLSRRSAMVLAALDELAHDIEGRVEERTAAAHAIVELEGRLGAAIAWRDRLASDPRLIEVEETDAPDLEATGLADRLRRRASAARSRLLASRVEGAEGERSLEWLREHGLLPSPLDVRRVVDALLAAGHPAHAGPAYLEQNLPSAEVRARIAADPARFTGVVVTSAAALARARELAIEGLHAPVQVSLLASLDARALDAESHVVLPDAAQWDRAAADERQAALRLATARREERERGWLDEEAAFTELGGDVGRYLAAHGGGALVRLEQDVGEARERARLAEAELAELRSRQARTRSEREALEARGRQAADAVALAERALERAERFAEAHERAIDDVRRERDEVLARITALEAEADRAKEECSRHREHAARLRARADEEERAAQRLAYERDDVSHREAESIESPLGTIEEARGAYETACGAYEGRLTKSRIRWELERCESAIAALRGVYQECARGLDEARVDVLSRRDDLWEEVRRIDAASEEALTEVAHRRAVHQAAVRLLEDQRQRRREVEDLPADRARPVDAAAARALALELEAEAEGQARLAQEAQEDVRMYTDRSGEATRALSHCRSKMDLLRSSAEMAGIALTPAPPIELPEALPAIDALVDSTKDRFRAARERAVWRPRIARRGPRSGFARSPTAPSTRPSRRSTASA